jgi:hypothetical protein
MEDCTGLVFSFETVFASASAVVATTAGGLTLPVHRSVRWKRVRLMMPALIFRWESGLMNDFRLLWMPSLYVDDQKWRGSLEAVARIMN